MRIVTTFLMFFSGWLSLYAQPGCTDPQALNHDATAVENDGSCNYALTEYTLGQVVILPDELVECSGVEWLQSGLWIHNDAGNLDKLYRIDSLSGQILQTITIAGADNMDWEDITEDDTYLYLGDFGNNLGNRTDLGVYRIAKSELSNSVVNADWIGFEYSDQTDFTENNNDHDFDCEAIIHHEGNLHLFTKNWDDNQTKHYVFSATPGDHTAQLLETFDVGGLITGADISSDGELILIGYTEFGVNFMWLMFDYTEELFFSGNKRKIALGLAFPTGTNPEGNSQTEGITFRENGYGYVCSEEFNIGGQTFSPQKLLTFSIKQWVDNTTSTNTLDDNYRINVFPSPFQGYFQVELNRSIDRWRLVDARGLVVKSSKQLISDSLFEVSTKDLNSGIYFFEIEKDGKTKGVQIMKY